MGNFLNIMPDKKDKKYSFMQEPSSLTPRELEIIKLIAHEYSTEEIAKELFISENTVGTHRKNLLRKTNSKNVAGLVKYAIRYGIIRL